MNKIIIALLVILCIVFIFHALYYNHVQDDAYISYRYVENFVEGHGLVFNYGEHVEGYTNFLWIMILALAVKLGLPIILTSQILGIIFGLGIILISAVIAREICGNEKWYLILIPPFLLTVNGALAYWTIGGMETALFVFLVSLVIYVEFRKPAITPYLLVLLTLCRPEGGLFFGIIFIYRLFIVKSGWKALLKYALVYTGLMLPYAAFKLIYFGDLLPNPFYAKTGSSVEYIKSGISYLAHFSYHYAVFGVLFILPFIFIKRITNKLWLTLLSVIIVTIYVVLVGGDVLKVHRFFLPILPFLYINLVWTLKQFKKSTLAIPLMLILTLWCVYIPWDYINNIKTREIGLIETMGGKADLLLECDSTDFSIATTTIGVLSYKLKGHKVIDMLGLTDRYIAKHPEKIEGLTSTWKELNFNSTYLLQQEPDYIMFSTGYKPSAPAERALFLGSQFRRNYSSLPFLLADKSGLTPIWKKTSDRESENHILAIPDYVEVYHDFFNAFGEHDFEKCKTLMREILNMGVNDFGLSYQLMGTLHFLENEYDSAFKYYNRALLIDPHNIESRLNIYAYYANTSDTAKQHLILNQIDSLAPWLSRPLRQMSRN